MKTQTFEQKKGNLCNEEKLLAILFLLLLIVANLRGNLKVSKKVFWHFGIYCGSELRKNHFCYI